MSGIERIPEPIACASPRLAGVKDVTISTEVRGLALDAIDGMVCDHVPLALELGACKAPVWWAPRLSVPSRTQNTPGHRHIHKDFPIHYCELHRGELKLDAVLAIPRLKGAIEDFAKRNRPLDFRCDFEAAHLTYVAIFSEQYEYHLACLRVMGRQKTEERWGALIADV